MRQKISQIVFLSSLSIIFGYITSTMIYFNLKGLEYVPNYNYSTKISAIIVMGILFIFSITSLLSVFKSK